MYNERLSLLMLAHDNISHHLTAIRENGISASELETLDSHSVDFRRTRISNFSLPPERLDASPKHKLNALDASFCHNT